MTYIVKISVRALVEYVFRSGNLESGFRTGTALTEGIKAHQKIQKTYKDSDQKEVFLHTEIPFNNLEVFVEGRCDGLLIHEDGTILIDEIKSTSRSLYEITEDTYPVHWAQAIFYAYMYAKENLIQEMNIRLTYVQVQTEEQRKFFRKMSFLELEQFVWNVIEKYAPFALLRSQHIQERDESIKELPFPFAKYRKGQRKLASVVYKTILDGKNLFAKASTGIGKTISTIFPAVKAIGEGHLERIFYLTAKTITRTAAEEAFSLLEQKGLKLHVVTITAKDKICTCGSGICEFAEGYYDKINDAIQDILAHETIMTRTVIEKYAHTHMVCPFEFSLDLAYLADAVICDYNYIFDPRVTLKRLFEEQKKKAVLLIDEAHNLAERSRDMYSAEIQKSNFLQLKREFKNKNADIMEATKALNDYFLKLKKEGNVVKKVLDGDLIALLDVFVVNAEKELLKQQIEVQKLLLDTYFAAKTFVKISALYDEHYVAYMEAERSEVVVKLFCLDPSFLIQQMGKSYHTKIFFSATLTPTDYYTYLLGGKAEDYVISITSPFDPKNTDVFIQPLSTRYRDRDKTMVAIVSFMIELLKQKPGNFFVFFPSYVYMQAVYEEFIQQADDVNIMVQNVGMTEAEREAFLEAFTENGKERLVGFAVLGGIFSEGIDLKGDRLQGVIVVGVGLPQICLERDIIKDYFTSIGRNGYDYAYVYPGMNKVLQAGGRLIRTELDHGTIVLIDDRFLQSKYQVLLPPEWQHYQVVR